jgi:hypothetical protein
MMNAVKAVRASRRSFFWKLGAGISTTVASTVGLARPGAVETDELSLRVAMLEEEKLLRRLHDAYQQAMDKGHHEEALGMFAADAAVLFNGREFSQRGQGLSRLYREHFPAGKTGGRMQPAPGFGLDASRQQDRVQIAADRLTATAAYPYSIQVGMPIESETSLASMARLHGEGVQTWWEGGVYNATYVKAAEGSWKIRRLEYNTLSRADYRPGRSYATAIAVSPIPSQALG